MRLLQPLIKRSKPLLTSVESVELAITAANTKDITVDLSDSKDVTSVKLTTVDAATTADDTEITLKGVATTDAVDLAMSAMTTGTLTSATVTYDAVTGTLMLPLCQLQAKSLMCWLQVLRQRL